MIEVIILNNLNDKIDINKIPSQVLCILELLEYEGYSAYLVGGSVRDILLDREPHDWDISTSAPLEVLQSLYTDCKVVGAAFGVVLIKVDGLEMQIARFRTEQGYSDYRHPDTVLFTDDIMEDLQRRDFTINTFSMDSKGNLVYVDGALDDLKNGIIRAVGDPYERFNEDPLRMMRACRFACQLEFFIAGETETAILMNYNLINNISKERIQEELNKILLSKWPQIGIWKSFYLDLLKDILPEMTFCFNCKQNNHHVFEVFEHITETLCYVPNELTLRLTALFHDIGKPKCKTIDIDGNVHFYGHDEVSANMAKEIMIRLKYDNQTIDEVTYLVRNHMELMNYPMLSDKGCRKLLNRHGESRLRKLIELRRADLLGSGTRDKEEVEQLIQGYRDKLEEVLKEKPVTKFEDLAIDGNDIMEITGLKPGKEVGLIKNQIMEIVLDNPELNVRERLLNILRRMEICRENDIKYMNNDKQLNEEEAQEVLKIIDLMDEAISLKRKVK
jgi:tRNA nucleotidyltransferase (CCA-adding enzyme)